MQKMVISYKEDFQWPGLERPVEQYISECMACTISDNSDAIVPGAVSCVKVPGKAQSKLGMDQGCAKLCLHDIYHAQGYAKFVMPVSLMIFCVQNVYVIWGQYSEFRILGCPGNADEGSFKIFLQPRHYEFRCLCSGAALCHTLYPIYQKASLVTFTQIVIVGGERDCHTNQILLPIKRM